MSKRKHKVFAFCYDKRGNLLSEGHNSYVKTHPIQAKFAKLVGQPSRIYLHAEVAAILKAPNINKIHRIFVVRYNRQGHALPAKPCPICQAFIEDAGIKVIEHS